MIDKLFVVWIVNAHTKSLPCWRVNDYRNMTEAKVCCFQRSWLWKRWWIECFGEGLYILA